MWLREGFPVKVTRAESRRMCRRFPVEKVAEGILGKEKASVEVWKCQRAWFGSHEQRQDCLLPRVGNVVFLNKVSPRTSTTHPRRRPFLQEELRICKIHLPL